MSITKLYAGVEGDPLNSSGPQIRDTVNQLIETHANSLKTLPTAANAQTDTVYNVIGFYEGTTVGGGKLVWLASSDKTLNDGLNYYAPEAISAWNGTHGDLSTLYGWSGSGLGVFKRVSEEIFTPEMAGAAGGANDDTLALNQYAQKVNGDVQIVGSHTISDSINIPHTKSVIMSAAAWIYCIGSAFDAVFDVPTGVPERKEYSLSNIDCNGIAGTPLWLRQGKDCDISCSNCIAPRMYGLHLGSSGTIISYGHHVFNYRANRQAGITSSNNLAEPIANNLSVGLYEQNTTDIKGVNVEMVGFQTGHIGGGTGIYFSFHVWASQKQNLMDVGFVPGGSAKYFGAHADQVQIAAFDILSGRWRVGLYGCVHFNSPNGGTAVSTSVSVRVDPEVQSFICYGLEIKGNVAGVLQDFVVTNTQLDSVDFVLEGTTYEFVTNRLARYKRRVRGVNLEAVTDTGSRGIQMGTSSTQTFVQDDRVGGLIWRGQASGIQFNQGAKNMSFNGNTPVARPTVTGPRAGNAALASLLSQLAILGLITDDTTS